jgi:hypothetical protein
MLSICGDSIYVDSFTDQSLWLCSGGINALFGSDEMRLLFTSLLAGCSLLAVSATASAEELRLDDAALDNVTAGQTYPGDYRSQELRRNFLVGTAAIELSNLIVTEFNQDPVGNAGALPVILPIVLTLQSFGNSLLPPAPPPPPV